MSRKKDDPQVSSSSSEYFTRADKKAEGVKHQAETEGITDDLARFKLQVQVERGEDVKDSVKEMEADEEPEEDKSQESQNDVKTKSLLKEVKEQVEDAKEKSTTDKLVKKEKKQRAIERKMAQEGEIQQEAG